MTLRASADARLARALAISHLSFEKKVVETVSSNPKLFWKAIRSQLIHKPKLNAVLNTDGALTKTAEETEETAECFNVFFASVFTSECTDDIPGISPKTTLKIINMPLDEEEVKKIISSLLNSRSPKTVPDFFLPFVQCVASLTNGRSLSLFLFTKGPVLRQLVRTTGPSPSLVLCNVMEIIKKIP